MNSYQRLKIKSKQREEELLKDINTLINGNEYERLAASCKYALIEKFGDAVWVGESISSTPNTHFNGILNQIEHKDEKPNE